jgi:hypothetical protein
MLVSWVFRLLAVFGLIAAVAATAASVSGGVDRAVLRSNGIGSARFGETEREAVAALTRQFGRPTARLVNAGCGPRLREVEWRHLYAEFRGQRFAGVRYLAGPWPPSHAARNSRPAATVLPRLVTAKGISLGSTLGELRAAYKPLRLIGTDRWRSRNGLVFYDNAQHDPPPASSRIVEIKGGRTCGDF